MFLYEGIDVKKALLLMLALSLVAVPAALADKPAPKPKPIASEKTWVKLGGGKNYGTNVTLNALGVTVTPLRPGATASTAVRFPITQGKVILTTSNGVVTGPAVRSRTSVASHSPTATSPSGCGTWSWSQTSSQGALMRRS